MPLYINSYDRSFHYGDGIFTTMLVREGDIQLWDLHLQRLKEGVSRLSFGEVNWQAVYEDVHSAISSREGVIKVLISRGEGGRGYSASYIDKPKVYVFTSALPNYQQHQQQGVIVDIAKLKLGIQSELAGLKHNNRLEQVLLKQELEKLITIKPVDDLLVCDTQGVIVEAISANVFFYKNKKWHTPKLDKAGVSGVMRQHLMQQLDVMQVSWQLPELEGVEAMFICNALMGVVPVKHLANKQFDIDIIKKLRKQVIC